MRYPVALAPGAASVNGADQPRDIEEAVCETLPRFNGDPGVVDCDAAALRSPSPAALVADTSKLYSRPPCRPAAIADVVLLPYVPTRVLTADPGSPLSRYSR